MIGLIVIATGKYDRFVAPLWASIESYFLPAMPKRLFVFTDSAIHLPGDVRRIFTAHEPWPRPTLHRYRHMARAAEQLAECSHLFYLDADMLVLSDVGSEVLSPLVAVRHPGYYRSHRDELPYERRPRSLACVERKQGRRYYAGGVQGGETERYLAAVIEMDRRIRDDERNSIVAAWHDESHWNRYLIDNPPTTELPPSYCHPEGWPACRMPNPDGGVWPKVILALAKDHAEMRAN